jgi:PKD repeat protein
MHAAHRTLHAVALSALCAVALAPLGCDDDGDDLPPRNSAPSVNVSANLTLAKADLPVRFTADATDPEGNISTYSWDFGDGQSAAAAGLASIDHAFASTGTYVVTITVVDEEGLADSSSISIDVTPAGGPPTLTVERLEIRGKVIDQTVATVLVNGVDELTLDADGVFIRSEDVSGLPLTWGFEATDQGSNTTSRSITLSER